MAATGEDAIRKNDLEKVYQTAQEALNIISGTSAVLWYHNSLIYANNSSIYHGFYWLKMNILLAYSINLKKLRHIECACLVVAVSQQKRFIEPIFVRCWASDI